MGELTGPQRKQFNAALRDAFRLQRFDELLQHALGIPREDIALGDDYQGIVFKVIDTAERENWTMDLLRAAHVANGGNPKLLAFAELFGAAIRVVDYNRQEIDQNRLEKIIKRSNKLLDLDKWRSRLGEIEGRICRIEIATSKGKIYGTGFLVAPDVVMTTYHVIEAVHKGEQGTATAADLTARAKDVVVRFDYKLLSDGRTLHPGTCFHLAEGNWLIDASPMSEADLRLTGLPAPDELDYALLRIDGRPGEAPIGTSNLPEASARGWIELHDPAYTFDPGSPLFIIQHPSGAPLKLALDTDAIITVNQNQTRVTYRTNTEPGSSGSPCFNQDWTLVALHHIGDPSFISNSKDNQGIPISAILRLLKQRNIELGR